MNADERRFLDSIDCAFPYNDEIEALSLAHKACELSANAAFTVVEEVCRPPQSASPNPATSRRVLEFVEANLGHTLVPTILPVARMRLRNEWVEKDEAIRLMRSVEQHPGQYAALNVIYFSVNEHSNEIDAENDRIRKSWMIRLNP